MAIEFDQPVVAGTVLIREDIRSQNYTPGSAGWRIAADGNAELNAVTIRGGTVVSGTALYYNGAPAAGNLIMSLAAAPGTDPYGNAYEDGMTVYASDGSRIKMQAGAGATQYFTPQQHGTDTYNPGTITTTVGGFGQAGLQLLSGNTKPSSALSGITLFGGSGTLAKSQINLQADTTYNTGDVTVQGTLTAGNRYVGSVLVTPSAANTPTSLAVTWPALSGTTFRGVASAETTVPGTQVTGVGLTGITSTGGTVWVTRTNTTQTRVDFIIEGF